MHQSGEKVRSLREESNPGNCTDGGGDTDSTYHQHHMRRVWDIFFTRSFELLRELRLFVN